MVGFAVLLLAVGCLGSTEQLFRPRVDGRIVGGKDVEIEDYPHQLSLQHYGGHICGASIISVNWALTAAHCVYNANADEFSVRAGTSSKGIGGQVVDVKRIIQHKNYDPSTIDFDYALLELNTPLTLGKGVKPIPLANNEPEEGKTSTVTGWGALQEGGSSPNQLQGVNVQIVSRKNCNVSYGGKISDRMICAYAEEKDSCQGDSGGPLISEGVLVGVVSWGYGCARPFYPGVYSSVAAMREWIKSNSGV